MSVLVCVQVESGMVKSIDTFTIDKNYCLEIHIQQLNLNIKAEDINT